MKEVMIQGKKMIKVGTSLALIIPAKTMRKMGLTIDSVFDIDDDGDVLVIRPRKSPVAGLALPKLSGPIEIDEGLRSLTGSVSFSEEELNHDERLKAIVES